MSAPTLNESPSAPPTLLPPALRCPVVIEDQARIPGWVIDLETFRNWTRSDEFPQQGLFAYLQGDIWADLSPEELLTHNRIKVTITATLGLFSQQTNAGSFVADRMRWSNIEADLSTEPDGLFYTWATLQSGRLRFVPGTQGGIIELEGTPDMVLEIVSASSLTKDTVRLRDLYWRAGVTEYWLVDLRSEMPRFDILRHTAAGFAAVESKEGWLTSAVFGRAFQLKRQLDPLGHPAFLLEVQNTKARRKSKPA
jgi:Uma2 family endonuclease